jgi:glucokinase
MRYLAGDVGGTKTLLRCVDERGAIDCERRFDSGAFATFDELLRVFLHDLPETPRTACFAVAGPVFGQRAEITNLGWTIDSESIAGSFGIHAVSLINDFFAVALGVPLLEEGDVLPLHEGARDRTAPIAILGAGTGLGEAIVTVYDGRFHVIPTEGGHCDFAPQDEEQARLFIHLHQKLGHVSWERLLSGEGIVSIYSFLGGSPMDPAEIAERAAAGDPRAAHTFEIFVDLYGAEAGNMALRILARGGVFLAGGIAAKNIPWFTDGRFVEAFLRKGRFRPLLETIPVDLIVNEQVGLLGAVEAARRMA